VLGTAACAWYCCLSLVLLLVLGTAACAWYCCLCLVLLLVASAKDHQFHSVKGMPKNSE